MTETAKSWCLTCPKVNGNASPMAQAEAAQHKDRYPDHHMKTVEEKHQEMEPKAQLKPALALIIPKATGKASGCLIQPSRDCYFSYLEARLAYPTEDFDIIWPASHDEDGFYSVTE